MQVTQTMYIRAEEVWDFESSGHKVKFTLTDFDMSEHGWIIVGTHDVTFEAPDAFDMRTHKAKAIEKEMAKVRADFQARITELQRTYNELLAIEGA